MNNHRSFFCDESCQTSHSFLGVGGICIEEVDISQFCDEIKAIKRKTRFKRLEWKKLRSAAKLYDPLAELIDLFYKKITEKQIYYFVILAEAEKIRNNKKTFPLYQQLFLQRCCRIFNSVTIDIYLDRSNEDYSKLQRNINRAAQEKFRPDAAQIVIHPHDSKRDKYFEKGGEIQEINDIVTGAILYSKNKKNSQVNRTRRCFLSNYLRELFKLQNYDINSSWNSRFNIWNFKS